MADLAKSAHRFKEKGGELAVIGSGDPKHFAEFRNITGYQGLLFTDPSLTSFSFLGFSNSITGVAGAKPLFKAISAFAKGHRQGAIQGNTLQLGGATVIDVAGTVRYYFAGKKAGDHPQIDDLLAALEDE